MGQSSGVLLKDRGGYILEVSFSRGFSIYTHAYFCLRCVESTEQNPSTTYCTHLLYLYMYIRICVCIDKYIGRYIRTYVPIGTLLCI